ncbi:hypothetical protein QQ045_018939 [Rhodiola kirilowii]
MAIERATNQIGGWEQLSGWLKEGDMNTKFFHERATQRMKRNNIQRIRLEDGSWISGDTEICSKAAEFFEEIFRAPLLEEEVGWREGLSCIQGNLSNEWRLKLVRPFTTEEVKEAMFQLGPTKAPGVDGFSAIFYHKFWDLVKREVFRCDLDFLNRGSLDRVINETLITLVPKVKNPEKFDEFRPISLVNVMMKVITKALANRLKNALPQLLSISQSAFIPGRLISDNILLAHELMHYMKTRPAGGAGYYCVKLDMSKAYDRVRWDFLEAIQLKLGFPKEWVDKVMMCVKSVSYMIKVNGVISEAFYPERGLRQGDPLSPYLFVICTEWLARNLEWSQNNSLIRGVKVSRGAPMISGLLYADDSIFFLKADVENTLRLKSILRRYELLTGQRINYSKSEMCVGNNVRPEMARALRCILGVNLVNRINKYLGLPICFSRKKSHLFNFIEDRIWKKVSGWKEKFLSSAGKETLIKAVIQTIPVYVMNCFKLPVSLCNKLLSIVGRYWWNDAKDKRYIAWVGKKELCKHKKEGGMSFKVFNLMNDALLVKQAWGILHCPELLISRVYKAKYFPNDKLLMAEAGDCQMWIVEAVNTKDLTVKDIYAFMLEEWMRNISNVIGESSDNLAVRSFWHKFWRVKAQGKDFWRQLLGDSGRLQLCFTSMADWIWYCVKEFDGEELSLIFYGIRWIWYARNVLWHNGANMELSAAVSKVKAIVKEISRADYRFVISRDEAGGRVEKCSSATAAEGKALLAGLKEADRHGICRASFITDSAEVLLYLQGRRRNGGEDLHWIRDCQHLLEKHEDWRLAHVLREGNRPADFLASKAKDLDWSWSSSEAIPWCISNLVKADLVLAGMS